MASSWVTFAGSLKSERITQDLLAHPLLTQGQLEQVAQVCTQSSFDYLHSWRHHNISGQNLSIGRNARGSDHP